MEDGCAGSRAVGESVWPSLRMGAGSLTQTAYGFGLRVRASRRTRSRTDAHAADPTSYPDWSPNGQRVVFTRIYESEDRTERSCGSRRGPATRRLTDGSDPAWSIKGTIAFVHSDGGIYVIRPDGSGLRRVVRERHRARLVARWSPDRLHGRRRTEHLGGASDGRGARRLRCGSSPSFSPNGHKIVYIGCDGRLQIMGAAGKAGAACAGPAKRRLRRREPLEPDWQPLP